MDFSFSEEQLEFKQRVIEFATRELNDNLRERERAGQFSRESWAKCVHFGLVGLPVSQAYGGLGCDIVTCLIAMEGLGYACQDGGLVFSLNSHLWTCANPISKFGSEDQKEKYLPGMCDGSRIGGHAITEPDSGSDAYSMRSTAVRKGDRYILNGSKLFVTNAPIADVLLVFASTNRSKGFAGISAFIVEKSFPGFSVGKAVDKMGLRTSPLGEVILQDCEVPAENLLGREGGAAAIFNSEMEWERSCLFATHVGAMEKILESCVKYAKERHQFGAPIGSFQAISHKIADMRVRIELSRLMLCKVASMKLQGKRAPLESSIAKVFVSESFVASL